MYQVYMNGRKIVPAGERAAAFAFHSYEAARSFVRKKIRQLVKTGKARVEDFENGGGLGFWDNISRNPTACFSSGMFKVKRVG